MDGHVWGTAQQFVRGVSAHSQSPRPKGERHEMLVRSNRAVDLCSSVRFLAELCILLLVVLPQTASDFGM